MFGPPKVQPVLVLSNFFVALSFVTVSTRVYTRHIVVHAAGIEDYLICISLEQFVWLTVALEPEIKYGLGQHLVDIPPENRVKFFRCLWATIPVYNFSLTFCKLSIIFQYKHVFVEPTVQKICRYFLSFLVVYGLWTVLGSVFMCVPVSFFWGVGHGSCMNRLAFWFSNAALNITTDIAIISIPMPLIRKLQIPARQKLVLMVVFAFGAFSMPALKPLVSSIFPKLLGMSSANNRSNGYSERFDSHPMRSFAQSKNAGISSASRSRDIYVEQTFEVRDEGEMGDVGDGVDGKTSREGSERNLVTSTAVQSKGLPFN
ncbi:integral membrane protein [Grosmannia clavigera kw1407]|uniref:Integral membrane protein n=1 Tax=Grosmannia clavigera (strain kw1407 / UAMH 11150) TaxID=655863 RepID=F0XBH3_GROCL|nr:uncharacterized protein CMQ_5216 [Grosmannia clavigera kw1407]EFX04954.1 integral membrane protein [Grosmannia clavigera kw1407]